MNIIRRGGFYTVYLFAFVYYLFKFRGKFDIIVDCENGIPFFTPLYITRPKVLLIHHVHQEVIRKHLRFPLKQIGVFLESRVMPLVYRNCQVITISNSSKSDILGRKWAKEDNIEIVTPAIDQSQFKTYPKTQNPSFIYLGRVMPWKNVDVALKAFAKVFEKYPSSEFTVAGFGESLPYLKVLARSLNIENGVKFLGFIPEEIKDELFGRSWAAIQPSSFEGWGITVIESNAAGTPVIASDIKGLKDSVIDNRTGLLFPLGNVNKLAEYMEKMIIDTELRDFLTGESYEWSKNFSWDFAALEFEKVLVGNLSKKDLRPAYEYLGDDGR